MIRSNDILELGYEYHQDNDVMKDEDVFRWPQENGSPYWLILKEGSISVQTSTNYKGKIQQIQTNSIAELEAWHNQHSHLRK